MSKWNKLVKMKDDAQTMAQLTPQEIAYLKRIDALNAELAKKGASPVYKGMQNQIDQTTEDQEKQLKQKELTPEELYLQNIDSYSKSIKQNLLRGK